MRSLLKLFAFVSLFALVLACGQDVQEPQVSDDDAAFLTDVAACQPMLDAWKAVLGSATDANLCTDHPQQAGPAAEALTTCWQQTMTPEDPDLLRVRRLLLQAATSYGESVEYLSDYCQSGSTDSLAAATASLDLGSTTLETVNALLDAYWARHPSWKGPGEF